MTSTNRRTNVLTLDRLRLAMARNRSASSSTRPETADELLSCDMDAQARREIAYVR